jgi:dipeptidyl-peptidase-4
MNATKVITLKDVTGNTFSPQYVTGVNPLPGTDQYANISDDRKQILTYSFKNGKQTGVMFDVNNTQGEKMKDGERKVGQYIYEVGDDFEL